MADKQTIASSFDELWGRLNKQWNGEDSNAFHQQYITKMTETIESFEGACVDLGAGAEDLAKELKLFECDIT